MEKYKGSSNILARVSHDSTPKESTSSAVVGTVNTENSQSHNVKNVVANLNQSSTLNLLSSAEFKDCQININITKEQVDKLTFVSNHCNKDVEKMVKRWLVKCFQKVILNLF